MKKARTRFVSFNVCGIKGILSKCAQWLETQSLESMFDQLEAEVICFQETKLQVGDITKDLALVPHFNSYFSCSQVRKGYSGVAFYVRDTIRVYKAEEGLTGMLMTGPPGNRTPYKYSANSLEELVYPEGISEIQGRRIDEQGRSITLDLGFCVVIGVYCPANSQGNMGDYREQFFQLLDWRVSKLLELGREVIVLGDINVAREPRDSAPLRDELRKQNIEIDIDEWKYGSVPRKAVNDWIEQNGMVDTTRQFHESRSDLYTCWNVQKNCRPANFGSRIDYIIASKGLNCLHADIWAHLVGSDHCPLYADFDINTEPQGGSRKPFLSRAIADQWNHGIRAFFSSSSHKVRGKDEITKHSTENGAPPSKFQKTVAEPNKAPNAAAKKTPVSGQTLRKEKQVSLSSLLGSADESWRRTSEKLKPPVCEHKEPCVLKRSSKPPRKGEYFWMCNRSAGEKSNPSGEFRCKTFIWDAERDVLPKWKAHAARKR